MVSKYYYITDVQMLYMYSLLQKHNLHLLSNTSKVQI